jgi:hypothetical protein
MTLPSDSPDRSAYCWARFLASSKARARASLTSFESSAMEKLTALIRVVLPPALIIVASAADAASILRILTWMELPAR